MTTILRSIGNQLRLVGPLTVANYFLNPDFQAATGGVPDNWDLVGDSDDSLVVSTDQYKFGGQSCFLDSGGNSDIVGLTQTIQNFQPGYDYNFSAWFFFPAPLPNPLELWLTYFDINQDPIGDPVVTTLIEGLITNEWIHTGLSVLSLNADGTDNIPTNTDSLKVQLSISVNTDVSFYVDGMMWGKGSDIQSYVDGSFSSYVWADGTPNSQTLLSTAPEELSFFNDGSGVATPIPVVA